jgi:hypothetical protein
MTRLNFRRNIWIEPPLWKRVQTAARRWCKEQGRSLSVAAYVRAVLEEALGG